MNNPFDEQNTQFELSYELLYLLRWLAEHESEAFRKIIRRAVRKGFGKNLPDKNDIDALTNESLQSGIVDFFNILDASLFESLQEQEVDTALQKEFLPAVNQLDGAVYDDETVRSSIEKASSHQTDNKDTIQEALFKELLKNWKPTKKTVLN